MNTKINNFHSYASSGADDDSFVGLKIIGNQTNFYYPIAYDFKEDSATLKSDIVAVLKTISIAKTKKREKAELFTERNSDNDFALSSYLWVINDFLTNGFYINREKVYKTNQNGKVNWKKTLANTPIVSKSNNIIYKDIVVETKSTVDNLLVEIHKYCVKLSIDRIGWLFNLDSSFIVTKPLNKTLYLTTLTKELSHTFDDDKKIRLSHLKNVIQGLDENLQGKDFVYGVEKYDYVYERMIDSVFGNEDVAKFYPKGQWCLLSPNKKTVDSSNLRPDTVLTNGQDVYILDSKFYRYGVTGDVGHLPETTSIQKQIIYGDFVKSNMSSKYKNIYNAFLIPYNKNSNKFNSNDTLFYIGYARTDSNSGSYDHEKVHTFLIDLKFVVNNWNKINHIDEQLDLINEIQKVI